MQERRPDGSGAVLLGGEHALPTKSRHELPPAKNGPTLTHVAPEVLARLPEPMIAAQRWLVWREAPHRKKPGKKLKIPMYSSGQQRSGRMDTQEDIARLTSIHDALSAAPKVGASGIGFVVCGEGVGGLDLDGILDDNGELIPSHAGFQLAMKAEADGVYMEVSPSGRGLRAFGPCDDQTAYSADGVEYYGQRRFLTVTGNVWANATNWTSLNGIRSTLKRPVDARITAQERNGLETQEIITPKVLDELKCALRAIPADERELWVKIGHALKTLPDEKGKALWLEWSATCPEKFDEADAERVWDTFRPINTNHKAVFAEAQRHGWDNPAKASNARSGSGVTLEDFWAHMPSHSYIFAPTREFWPAASVNSRVPSVEVDGERVKAAAWLDRNQAVEQMTWAPGKTMVMEDCLISDGGWIERAGCRTFNLYRPPIQTAGDAGQAGKWVEHVRRIYPDDADHILSWLAHRVQRPQDKINHAIVLGGSQGIGKDTLLEPVKHAIGPWNFSEVSPQQMLGRFNGFVKSVILRVSEARDLGDVDRFAFYDHMKAYTAAPPDVLRVDEKHLREYSVFNVCGVIITSNHKTDGIFLPEDDRRHYVAWSDLTKEDFTTKYWDDLWDWYHGGGIGHVAAYLATLDLSGFNAKAPPPKTSAFHDIVASNRAPEDSDLDDALEELGRPDAVTLAEIGEVSGYEFRSWLEDRRNSRKTSHRMNDCGYERVNNPHEKRGRWKTLSGSVAVYARRELSIRDRTIAAETLIDRLRQGASSGEGGKSG